jgi:hypothetical protein
VQLKFYENFIDDPVIEALVAEDASNLMKEGYTEMHAKRFSQARIKFEESFVCPSPCSNCSADARMSSSAWPTAPSLCRSGPHVLGTSRQPWQFTSTRHAISF